MAQRTKKKQRKWNRDIPDAILLCRSRQFDGIPTAPSLHPGVELIEQFIAGVEEAHAIVDAWAFRAPVVEVAR